MRVVHRCPGEEASTAGELRKSAGERVAEFERRGRRTDLRLRRGRRGNVANETSGPGTTAKRTGWLSASTSRSTTSSDPNEITGGQKLARDRPRA